MKEYICKSCNYNCGSKKSSYEKHLKSKKHIGSSISISTDDDNNDRFSEVSTTTPSMRPSPSNNPNTNINNLHNIMNDSFIMNEIQLLKMQNQLFLNQLQTQNNEIQTLKTQILMSNNQIQNQNNEIQTLKTQYMLLQNQTTQQSQEHIIFKNNQQQIQTANHPYTPVRNINRNIPTQSASLAKEKPKLSNYLKETCKDALNFEEFKKYGDIDMKSLIPNVDAMMMLNAKEFVKKTLFERLRKIKTENLPFRCIDVKNQKVIINKNGKWVLYDKNPYLLFENIECKKNVQLFQIYLENERHYTLDYDNPSDKNERLIDYNAKLISATNNPLTDKGKKEVIDELMKYIEIENVKQFDNDIDFEENIQEMKQSEPDHKPESIVPENTAAANITVSQEINYDSDKEYVMTDADYDYWCGEPEQQEQTDEPIYDNNKNECKDDDDNYDEVADSDDYDDNSDDE